MIIDWMSFAQLISGIFLMHRAFTQVGIFKAPLGRLLRQTRNTENLF